MAVGDLNPAPVSTTVSFTRPADTTAYASGDLVANSTVAGSVVPMPMSLAEVGGGGMIRRVRLRKSGAVLTNAAFRVHLYAGAAAPTVTNGDNGAWLSSGVAGYLGGFDVTIDKAFSDGSKGFGIPLVGSEVKVKLPGTQTTIWALIEARAAYTPASAEVFTLHLEVVDD